MDSTKPINPLHNNIKRLPFVSIRWKFIVVICGLAIIANALLISVFYQHLRNLLNEQQATLTKENAAGLLSDSRQHLVEAGQALVMAAEINSSSDQDSVLEYLKQNWDIYQIERGLVALMVDNEKTLMLGDLKKNATIIALMEAAKKNLKPDTRVLCTSSCQIFAAIPIQLSDGSLSILLLSTTLADFLIDFSRQYNIGTVLLRKDHSDTVNLRSLWQYAVLGVTNNGPYKKILDEINKLPEDQVPLHNGYSTSISTDGHSETKYYYLHTLEVEDAIEPGNSQILLISDITRSRHASYQIALQLTAITIGTSTVALFVLYFVLRIPLRRINQQARLLPLLAEQEFESVRNELENTFARRITHDELDILTATAINLSQRLESMQGEIDNRTDELENMALYDVLTGLANRRLFSDHLDSIIEDSRKNHERFAVVFIDLDNFKRINDSLGHDVGDELLIEVSKRLTDSVRRTDIVARLGGDEFTIISPQVGEINNVKAMLDKVVDNFQRPMELMGNEIQVTPSIGVSLGPDNGFEASELMRCADMAMYEAKQNGKNCYHFFTEEMNHMVQKELKLENELTEGIDASQFRLYYQPIVSLTTGKTIALEGLLRWLHPSKGLLAPAAFIDMLETSGLIVSLGEQIFHLACLDKKYLNSIGCRDIKISFNISAKQFKDPLLLDKLQNAMRNTGTEPNDFKIELTENTLMEDIEKQAKLMGILREMGFHIAIDDFGTGYSSLSYLKQLPVDVLKIDRSFIMDIPANKDDIAIVSAITAMAKNLNLQVVAEGIETRHQENFLKKINCDYGQGYLYQKPMPLEDMAEQLQSTQHENGALYGHADSPTKKRSKIIPWPN
ncbi:MAG: EAL domain-containing protein [Pseudomonadales bacterium]|nr:EAL domain-containing protein [Pseudomonadales bacterium]